MRALKRLLLVVLFCAVSFGAAPDFPVTAVDSIGLTVEDMDRSLEFFSKVLSFQKVSDVEVWGTEHERLAGLFGMRARVVRLRLGEEFIELTEYLTPKGLPVPVDSRSNDRWFQHIAIVVSDMDKAYRWLRQNRVEHASTGPQTLPAWNKNAGGIHAFYFKDPDKHALEILAFPPDKGDPRWHRSSGELFLGIDHTAIVVGDTDKSLGFYSAALGLKQAGGSENYGDEQEHLNNVFGARLRITTLRAAKGPGVELLEYLAPTDGRPYPETARSSDLINWQTNFLTTDSTGAERVLRNGKFRLVSPGAVELKQDSLGFRKAVAARDPDGHAARMLER
jgi:catechol 2,3-dioxygenase-like lactoylglutathione lyase family enzyme